MEVRKLAVNLDLVEQGMALGVPFVRMATGEGCGFEGCNCSPDNFITISDGITVMSVALNDDEMTQLLKRHELIEES